MQIQNIKKRSGIVTTFEPQKISRAIEKAFLAVKGSSEGEIIKNITDRVVADMENTYEAAVPTVENVQDLVEKEIMKQGFFEVAKAYILYRHEHNVMREKREKQMREKIKNNDFTVIKHSGEQEKFSIEKKEKENMAIQFYDVISKLEFIPSTPTLFHAGTSHPQLSSCYITTVDDSLDHIFKCIGDNAQLSKWSGGVANDWTSIRATGSHIKGTGVESQGVIPFLKIANDTTVAINRSGRRRGATCAYLEVWHYDFEDFLELRKNTGDERRRTHDMNTASWVPVLFMKRVRDNGQWVLLSPEEAPELHETYGKKFEEKYIEYEKMVDEGKIRLYKKLKARDLWKKMIMMLFETGHPWITFKDPCNIRSPQDHVGVVHSSNLCTEITLNTSADETAVCNLGSLNFAKFVRDDAFDSEKVKEVVTIAMRMLDNV